MMETFDFIIPGFCGMGLHFCLDGFRLIYLAVTVLMWVASGVFSGEYMEHYQNKKRYYLYFWATFAATAGVFLSANLYTTFLFFEIMSFTSYVWVAFDERKESLRAAETYLAVAVIGGLVMLMGLFLLYDLFGTLEIEELGVMSGQIMSGEWAGQTASRAGQAVSGSVGNAFGGSFFASPLAELYTAGGLLLFGFGAKAGCFPLHIWLPKAHPEAPAPASALLSGILTKAGVFGIIIISCVMFTSDAAWGTLIAALGFMTMFLGALLAIFSVNLKRTLACSSISQIGFIMAGIGMACLLKSIGRDNSLAVRGAFLHMINHSLFKLVLFLCAGAVFMNLHELDLNKVRGFGRKKPVLGFCFLMGALGISGIPLWSGYVSKTLIHESIVQYIEFSGGKDLWRAAEWLFLVTGGMTVAYMLKLFVALFVEENPERQGEFDSKTGPCMRPASAAALVVPAILLPLFGILPHLTMDRLAELGQGFFMGGGNGEAISYFSFGNLKGGLISIGIGIALYAVVVRGWMMKRAEGPGGEMIKRYVDRWPSWMDLENAIYRPVFQFALPEICAVVCRALDQGADGVIRLARATTHRQQPEPKCRQDKNGLAHLLGDMTDAAAFGRRKLPGRKHGPEERVSAVPAMIRREEQWKRTWKQVEESFSYGLLLVCIGLCLTLGYLLVKVMG